jgi:histidinol-phosphate aminotransferase
MSPTPVTFAAPTAPQGYEWEATNEEVARRYGVPLEAVARFDLNTSPAAPDLAAEVLAAGRFDKPVSEYPPSDYARLAGAAAARYGVGLDEILVGAGADEILDLIAKAFLPAGGRAVLPAPTYAMYRVLDDQRGVATTIVPRLGADDGFRLDGDEVRAAARGADLVWLCNPNNPTGLAEPPGAVEALLDGILADATADGGPAPVVILDEAYVEFTTQGSLIGLRHRYPRLVGIRTMSKAYGLAGLRVGFAIARPEMIARIAPYRPPGSVAVPSVAVAAAALETDGVEVANVERVISERAHVLAGLARAGWRARPSVTNFVLVDLGSPEVAEAAAEHLLQHGLVPRTFGSSHPLAHCLRITVRDRADDDRLIAAAGSFVPPA